MSNFFDIFFAGKQFFEKISIRGGQQLIVLNPFLDSLSHFDLKNIGLPPGTGSGCFQSSQDVVKYSFHQIDLWKTMNYWWKLHLNNLLLITSMFQTLVTKNNEQTNYFFSSSVEVWALLQKKKRKCISFECIKCLKGNMLKN